MKNLMLEKLKRDEVTLGLCMMYPAPSCIEGMCKGWDFVWVDGQHGQIDYNTVLHSVQVAELIGISSLVRVPGHCPDAIGPVLDTGASAVMVPMVNSAEEAKALVHAAYFPPMGSRSYGGRRVIDREGREYYKTANDEVLLVVQIETLEAVERAEEIAAVKGVGALFFGPDDMKMRMGIPINTAINESPELTKAMEKVAKACRNAGKIAGNVAGTAAALKTAAGLGYRLIIGGGDIAFMRVAAAAKLDELKNTLKGLQAAPGKGPQLSSPY